MNVVCSHEPLGVRHQPSKAQFGVRQNQRFRLGANGTWQGASTCALVESGQPDSIWKPQAVRPAVSGAASDVCFFALILDRLRFDMVDDQHLGWSLRLLQLEAEFLVDSLEKRDGTVRFGCFG